MRGADRMALMLDELLEFSRLGRKPNPAEAAALQAVVREAQRLVAGQLSERGAEVQVTEVPVALYGDRRRLVELFQNLLDNAVKFMGEQPARRIEVGVLQQGDSHAIFVRDNGTGIDPRHQGKLFGLFEKLDPTSDGIGIGLATAKRIVELHGGRIWVESAGLGRGATFWFTLDGLRLG